MRTLIAIRTASTPQQFINILSKYNSGTDNREWVAVNMLWLQQYQQASISPSISPLPTTSIGVNSSVQPILTRSQENMIWVLDLIPGDARR
jgi:hypothetical protein